VAELSMTCERCGATWKDGGISLGTINQAADCLRSSGAWETIKWLRNSSDLDLKDAKAVVFHLSKVEARCHRCNSPLSAGMVVTCSRCKSMNYQGAV